MKTQFITKLGFYRLRQIIGDSKANPPIEPLLPIGRSTFLAKVANGDFPKPIRFSARVSLWKVSDVMKMLSDIEGKEVTNIDWDNHLKGEKDEETH